LKQQNLKEEEIPNVALCTKNFGIRVDTTVCELGNYEGNDAENIIMSLALVLTT